MRAQAVKLGLAVREVKTEGSRGQDVQDGRPDAALPAAGQGDFAVHRGLRAGMGGLTQTADLARAVSSKSPV